MGRLQAAGVPAGICQTAEDRYEKDPRLRHLEWPVELPQTELGTWPVKGFPAHLDRSPAYAGGMLGRSGPNYGEDTQRILSSVLGMTAEQGPSCARLPSSFSHDLSWRKCFSNRKTEKLEKRESKS